MSPVSAASNAGVSNAAAVTVAPVRAADGLEAQGRVGRGAGERADLIE